jgi:hypothetical protein
MTEVQIRQWSDHCFAIYVFDGDRHGTFVDTAPDRTEAELLGHRYLREREELTCLLSAGKS